MSQDTEASPSATVNWREPTTEDKSKAGFQRPGWRMVSVGELVGDRFAVCLYRRGGKFTVVWGISNDSPLFEALKLGYNPKERTSWDSLEEAQSALAQRIQRARVLAVEAERVERRAKAEAAGNALFAARAAQMRDQEAEEKARYAAVEAALRSHAQENRRKHDNSKKHDIPTTIMLWAWFGFPVWIAVYAVVIKRSCAGTFFVDYLLMIAGGIALAAAFGKLLSLVTAGAANAKMMESSFFGLLGTVIFAAIFGVGIALTGLVLDTLCRQL